MKTDLTKYNYHGPEPKPEFNLKWYQGTDGYSEGSIEDFVIRQIVENDSSDYSETIAKNYSWSSFYHLTHIRQNILNWYPFDPQGSVLEIGCGMGAITELLCDRCKTVTAVEMSKRRATATLLRCREKENLEIVVGNLNDIEFTEKFDYITLIGVLEYQVTYTASSSPFRDFLVKIRSLLKPEGKLLIAIENKYGLKYWCGAKEDHTGIPFDGMNQYSLGSKMAMTFSKEELARLVKDSGYLHSYFYYPMPDYKLPSVVYSEQYLPKNKNMENLQPYYTDNQTLVANEMDIYSDIIKNNVFEFFANSFLVECSPADEAVGKVQFALSSTMRNPQYRVATTIERDKKVRKRMLGAQDSHLQKALKNLEELKEAGLQVVPTEWKEHCLETPFVQDPLFTDYIRKAYEAGDQEEIYRLWSRLYEDIKQSSETMTSQKSFPEELGLIDKLVIPANDKFLKTGYLDMIYRNCFVDEDENLHWFDQEWTMENVPASFILHRNLFDLYCYNNWMAQVLPLDTVLEYFGILHLKKVYINLDLYFGSTVSDQNFWAGVRKLDTVNNKFLLENIQLLMEKKTIAPKYPPERENVLRLINVLLEKKRIEELAETLSTLTREALDMNFPGLGKFLEEYANAAPAEKESLTAHMDQYEKIAERYA